MIHNELVHELIKVICSNIGFVPGENFGKAGLSEDVFKTDRKIQLEVENKVFDLPVYAGKIEMSNSRLTTVATVIRLPNEPDEFSVVFKVDATPTLAIRCNFEDFSGMRFINNFDSKWDDTNLYQKLISTAGFVKIADLGFIWKPCNDVDELHGLLTELVEM